MKQLLKELPQLVKAGVITEETAGRIEAYYYTQSGSSVNRLFLVFGILGGLLVGMGIVLIIAHNWDILPKAAKLAVGLLPLLIGQIIAGYLIFKKSDSNAWKEGTAAFLVFAVAISISIVSQVYNIQGNLAGFLLAWMLLSIPIIYVLWSSVASLLVICGTTWYGCEAGYSYHHHGEPTLYWLLLASVIPFYYFRFFKSGPKSNFFYFHSWLLAASVTICLGIFTDRFEEFILLAYMGLFSAFVIMGELKAFQTGRVISNAYLVVGSIGVIALMLFLSFDFYWEELERHSLEQFLSSGEAAVSAVVTLIDVVLIILLLREKKFTEINSKAFAFVLLIILLPIGSGAPLAAQLVTNIAVLILAVHTIQNGARQNHLGILNYGLLIITALIICRFFDTNISFVIRGLLFIGVGVGFFLANYYFIRKRKQQA